MWKEILLKSGQGLFLLMIAMIVYAGVTKDASAGDITMFLLRWPVLLTVFVLAPLLVLGIFLHARRGKKTDKLTPPGNAPE